MALVVTSWPIETELGEARVSTWNIGPTVAAAKAQFTEQHGNQPGAEQTVVVEPKHRNPSWIRSVRLKGGPPPVPTPTGYRFADRERVTPAA